MQGLSWLERRARDHGYQISTTGTKIGTYENMKLIYKDMNSESAMIRNP